MMYEYKNKIYYVTSGLDYEQDVDYPVLDIESYKMKQQDGSWVDCVTYCPTTTWVCKETGNLNLSMIGENLTLALKKTS